jgi:hypothetical protein
MVPRGALRNRPNASDASGDPGSTLIDVRKCWWTSHAACGLRIPSRACKIEIDTGIVGADIFAWESETGIDVFHQVVDRQRSFYIRHGHSQSAVVIHVITGCVNQYIFQSTTVVPTRILYVFRSGADRRRHRS